MGVRESERERERERERVREKKRVCERERERVKNTKNKHNVICSGIFSRDVSQKNVLHFSYQ